ncbi:hypothetical protein JYB62_09580 [Algoriphagus lutimaris]|uniref:hypothetical protein n=1 Tax=Algoriphagus lutimaris TaxID=613197 RepID=UPI00196B3EB6|nr:hypothetical protein [Algoriphagus lutimaris]MBN3520253.1 hypothetical protein [Algoriphagus lutimaris]
MIPGFPFIGENPLYGVVEIPDYVFPVLFASMVAAIILRKKALRHQSFRFVELDSPPGILYLRPFSEDTDWRVYYSWGRDNQPISFLNKLKVLKFGVRMQLPRVLGGIGSEFGEILSELTRDYGKVAAIGEPESPPILGADNVYVSDDNWQEKVLQMARGANLVILTAGTTPGVLWEVENMVKIIPPSKLILNVPGGTLTKRRKNYASFLAKAKEIFPRGLPTQLNARVITFKEDWSPILVTKAEPPKGSSSHVAWWMSHVLP